jgi:hypothetical protein
MASRADAAAKLCASKTARKTPISLPDDAAYRQLANLKREWNDMFLLLVKDARISCLHE